MQINAPFGYADVVPVLKTHRIRREGLLVPEALRTTNALPISFAEIPQAARDYPIVFVRPGESGILRAIALLGLKPGENLFVDADGRWLPGVYQPAYLRRYPFCMTTLRQEGQPAGERIICVERALIDDEHGEPVEQPDGELTPWWQQTANFLTEYEADLLRTEKVCDIVDKNGLLEPFTAQAVSKTAEVTNLTGMLRVSESELGKLKADTLRMLINKGVLARLYAHMFSLDRFTRLLDLQAERQTAQSQ